MEYSATAKYVHMSPRKVRLVARAIIGKKVSVALSVLMTLTKFASEPIGKLIASAADSAKQKNGNMETLVIASFDVMEGPVMKRWHAVSKGAAHSYKKRMSHIKVVLKEEEKKN